MVIVFVWLCAVGLLPPQRAGHHRRPALSPRRGPNSSCTGCAHWHSRARSRWTRCFGGHRRIGDGGARCHTVPHPPGAWHARTHGGHRRCIFRNCGDFFRTRTTSRGTSSVHGPRGARETGGAGRARGGRGFRTAAHAHSRTRISVRDRLTTQPRPLLRRPTCGNPQRLMCCHRTRRPPCHA